MENIEILNRFSFDINYLLDLGIELKDLKNIYERVPNEKYRVMVGIPAKINKNRSRITKIVNGSLMDAIKMKNNFKDIANNNILYVSTKSTFSDLASYWYIFLDNKILDGTIDENTVVGYKGNIKRYLLPYFSNKSMANVNRLDIERFVINMRTRKKRNSKDRYSNNTIAHAFKTLNQLMNFAVLENVILDNPCNNVRIKPTLKIVKSDYFSIDELNVIKKYLEDEDIRFKTAIYLIIDTGMRREELFGLKWEDIDFENNKININKAVTTSAPISKTNKNRIRVKDVKSANSLRKIGVPFYTMNILKNYKSYKMDNNLKLKESEFIFTAMKTNRLLSPNNLTKEWKNFVIKNDLKNITLKGLRHSHATFLMSLNLPVKDIASRMGHSIEMLLRTYTHSNQLDDNRIVNILNEKSQF